VARPPKKAPAESSTVVWVDEAGFYLLPLAVRTWAPRGPPPILRVPLSPDHLAAISGITRDGRRYMQPRAEAFNADGGVGFLRLLRRKIRGKVLGIWDRSPIHRAKPIKEFLARGAAQRLHLERWPGDAPDLTPDEGIGNSLTRVELRNHCCRDLAELDLQLRRAKERLRHKRDVIRACSVQCGYSV